MEEKNVVNIVDKTIEIICDWIQSELKHVGSMENSMILPEMTKALAELLSARASLDNH